MQTIRIIATLLFIATTTALAQTDSRNANYLFDGKHKTNHTVSIEAAIDAAPQEVYRLWTTADGVKKFFAPRPASAPQRVPNTQLFSHPTKTRKDCYTAPGARAFWPSAPAKRFLSSGSRLPATRVSEKTALRSSPPIFGRLPLCPLGLKSPLSPPTAAKKPLSTFVTMDSKRANFGTNPFNGSLACGPW